MTFYDLLKTLIDPPNGNVYAALAVVGLVDESRFSQTDELKCLPYFTSKNSWGLFRRRTKLLCRKCGNYIGSCYEESSSPIVSDNSDSSSGNGVGGSKKYNIRISALQPFSDVSGAPLFTS
ncbi:uncharacterized protein A4U43_C02F2460 [Asparagus officinalis]|uniref:Uncharacterized protein n=1 Tax=Asparagus officinalis TaxID=4686 RepID=A0A5P1FF97_ASPOF|nr:uncharacterized protein A4U43_C02F2460 [Asparagus officinalis]